MYAAYKSRVHCRKQHEKSAARSCETRLGDRVCCRCCCCVTVDFDHPFVQSFHIGTPVFFGETGCQRRSTKTVNFVVVSYWTNAEPNFNFTELLLSQSRSDGQVDIFDNDGYSRWQLPTIVRPNRAGNTTRAGVGADVTGSLS